MTVFKLTATDYANARLMLDQGKQATVVAGPTGFTAALAARQREIVGASGPAQVPPATGTVVKQNGLGPKWGAEARRLGIAAASPTMMSAASSGGDTSVDQQQQQLPMDDKNA